VGAATLVVLSTTWFSNLHLLAYVGVSYAHVSFVLIAAVLWVGVFDCVRFHGQTSALYQRAQPHELVVVLLQWICCVSHDIYGDER
jgi:hypothetical protein